jgi:hypothetical protein|tara:strand:- start:47 stop:796 length:750 start_codon:yes stop_codon:yes gene_type:complete
MKPLAVVLSWTMILFSLPVRLGAQTETRQTDVGGVTVEQTIQGEGKLVIAVLDLEGRGISALEAATLTDRMRSELVATGAVTIVERGQMQEILSEQGFQQTGCTSSECAVEVGKLLGVSHMATGSIGKIGSSYTLDVRLFNVEDGAITKSVNRTYKGEVDGLIKEIERLAWDIVGLTPPAGLFPETAAPVAAAPAGAASEKKGGRGLLWLVLLAGAGGGGYYAYSEGMLDDLLGIDHTLPGPPALPGSE